MKYATNCRQVLLLSRFSASFFIAMGILACAQAADKPQVTTVTAGLAHPWGLGFLPGGRFLVTERVGRLRVIEADGRLGAPLQGLPPIAAGGQGGLLDVLVDADYTRNRRIFMCYSEADARDPKRNSTALASAVLEPGAARVTQWRVLFSQQPKVASSLHFGCRIVQSPDGHLYLALGDRYSRRDDAQTLDNHHGKVVRLLADGSVPADNPLRSRAGALPEIWSWGHRNPQGATWGPDGRLWVHEHGPQGGDEINRPEAGKNYGWPVITYGEEYGGGRIGQGTAREGMEQPLHYWVPSIAPSGMAFLTSDRYGPDWKGSLFVGSLKFGRVHRLEVQDGKVLREERILEALGQRVRDVRQGPDGWLYLLTDSPEGQLLRVQR
jgi:glucose/arabinose dehydrogenase